MKAKIRPILNSALGIATEVIYILFIMLVAFLICLAFTLKK